MSSTSSLGSVTNTNLPGLAPVNVSDLEGGVDTDSIITELATVEREQEVPYQNQETVVTQRQTLYGQFNTDINNLITAADALEDPTLFDQTSTVTSTNASALTASYGTPTGESAIPGAYDIDVTQLAQDEVDTQQSSVTAAANSDTLDVTLTGLSGPTTGQVAINSGDSLSTIANKINQANLGVNAQVVNGKLQLNGPGQITVTGDNDGNGYNLATDLDLQTTQAHKTSDFTIGSTSYQRDTNTVDDALPGVTFTMLQDNTTTTVDVGEPTPNVTNITNAVQNFVNAYNTAYGDIHNAVNEKPVVGATSTSDLQTGTLFGDPTLTSLMEEMRGAMQSTLAGLPASMNNFAQIGISTGTSNGTENDSSDEGLLVFNASTLQQALTTDPNDVKNLLSQVGSSSDGSDSGLGNRFDQLLTPYTAPTTGVFAEADQSFSDSLTQEAASIQQIEDNVTQNVQMWQQQFTAMDEMMNSYSSINLSSLFPSSSS